MQNQRVHREIQRLNDLFERVTAAASGDDNLQSHWARYLTVLVSGLLETGLSEVYSEFVKGTSPEPVAKYAVFHLARIQNPNCERMLLTAGGFKEQWRQDLEEYLNDEGRREAVDSIINVRHNVAHGGQMGITIARVREYYEKAVSVLEFLERQCGK